MIGSDRIGQPEHAVTIDLRNLEAGFPLRLSDAANLVASRSEPPPALWILRLGDPPVAAAASGLRPTLEPLGDLVHSLSMSQAPVAALAEDELRGEALVLCLAAVHAVAKPGTVVRLSKDVPRHAAMVAFHVLALKLGQVGAERLLAGPDVLSADQAVAAGIVAAVARDAEQRLDAWRRSSPLADGTPEARALYLGLRWRFHAALRTGLIELADSIGSWESTS